MKYSVGIDLGGTKLAAALVDENGKILSFRKVSILNIKKIKAPMSSQKRIVLLMVDMILDFRCLFPKSFRGHAFAGIGLASAGPLNTETGCLVNPTNFSGWKTVPIKKMLRKALSDSDFSCPVFFQNDAIAAAYAEGWIGRAKKLRSYAVVTVGTGIGTGVIFQNLPVQTHGMGSEFGHVIIENRSIRNPGIDRRNWTVEGLASGTGILRRAQNLGFRGDTIEDLVNSPHIMDPKYRDLFDNAAEALAALCYNLSIGFNTEKILISGGLIKIRELFFLKMKKRYIELINSMNPAFKCRIQLAQCRNQAGVIGAAFMPLNALKR